MDKHVFFSYQLNEAVLFVTSYHKGQLTGWLSNSRLENPVEVLSVPHLLFLLDEFLVRDDKAVNYRAFDLKGMENIQCLATLRIRVLFQENHTWQGLLAWEEREMEASFRSVWDLIQLLDEVLAD